MSKNRPYMPLYIADYRTDTLHLTTEQHGAYLLLLMALWNAGGKLPDNDTQLSRIVCATSQRWAKMRDIVLRFFVHKDGTISHKRIDQELQKLGSVSQSRSDAGKKGGRPKKEITNAVGGLPVSDVKCPENNDIEKPIAKANGVDSRAHAKRAPDFETPDSSNKNPDGFSLTTPDEIQQKKITPQQALSVVLSKTRVQAIIDHRRSLKQPLTGYSASLLAAKYAEAPDVCGLSPDQAADYQIERGWRGFNAKWVVNAQNTTVVPYAHSPPNQPLDEFEQYARRLKEEERRNAHK